MDDAQILLKRKQNLGLQRPKNELHELYQMLSLYGGNGNSTWIINAAISMPGTKIRIVYASKVLADAWKRDYANLVHKMYSNPSAEKIKENVQFITPSEIKRNKNIKIPIIVDNSCLNLQTFEKFLYFEYNRGYKNGCEMQNNTCKLALKKQKEKLIKLLNSFWIFPFRRYLIERIEEIIII